MASLNLQNLIDVITFKKLQDDSIMHVSLTKKGLMWRHLSGDISHGFDFPIRYCKIWSDFGHRMYRRFSKEILAWRI